MCSLNPPFANAKDMYQSIDSIPLANIPWQAFNITYTGGAPWMLRKYIIWFHCPRCVLYTQLGNPDFASEMDFTAKQVFYGESCECKDFMSGKWVWTQVVCQLLLYCLCMI